MKRSILPLVIVLALVAAGGSFWLGRITLRTPGDDARLAQLQQENLALKSALEKLRSESATLRDVPANGAGARGQPSSRTPLLREHGPSESTESVRILQESLAATNKSLAAAEARLTELQSQLDQVRAENARLAALESSLTEQVASWKRSTESKEAELSRRHDEMALLETANKKLRDEAGASMQKTGQQLQGLNELQDIYRRRESYLNTLMGRYREVTEQYRAFTSVLENRRGPEGTSGTGISIAGPELGRIQNSIALAEEDLRQLNALNAQVARIQKRLATK